MIQTINKPWGFELIWAKTDKYVGKILHINSGHSLSKQYHNVKDETILVESGEMTLEIGDGENIVSHTMKHGDHFHITPKTIHRMIAITDVEVIEASTPELDDVIRLEDNYGRVDK